MKNLSYIVCAVVLLSALSFQSCTVHHATAIKPKPKVAKKVVVVKKPVQRRTHVVVVRR